MIIGLKANVFDIADTFRKAYPNARILYPGKDDFTKQNRQRIFADIKNNDWDCIILTHEQFGMIPQSEEIQQKILQDELDSVEENLEVLRQQGRSISRAMEKGLVKRQMNLRAKLDEIEVQDREPKGRYSGFQDNGYRPSVRGRVAYVQESDVQHPPRQSGRAWQQRRKPACFEYALC